MITDEMAEKCLDYIRDHADEFAQAKGHRVYLEEFSRSLKATLMKEALTQGFESAAAQEREAYSSPQYKTHIEGLREAVQKEEALRWKLVGAQTKIDVWRTQQANTRRG